MLDVGNCEESEEASERLPTVLHPGSWEGVLDHHLPGLPAAVTEWN
jgi:hypothetical protein